MSIHNNKIIKNFSILTITNVMVQVLSILSSIRVARQLQPEGYGMFNLIILEASIFLIFATYGLRIVMIRHIARNTQDAKKIFILSNQIRIGSTLLALILAIIYNQIVIQSSLSAIFLVALLLLIIFQTFFDSIESIFFGFEKMEASGILNLIFTCFWVAEVYIIPNKFFTVTILLYSFVLNQVMKTIIYYIWLYYKILRGNRMKIVLSFSDHKELIRQGNFYFILAIFTAIQNQIPILLLQFNSTVEQIGLFNLGNRILSPLQMMLSMLLTALFPMLSRLAFENQVLFALRVKILLNIIILTGIWGSLCFALFSSDIVHLLYGDAYKISGNVILIQCWFTVLFAIFCTIGTILSALDMQQLLTKLSIIYGIIAAPIFFFGTKFGAIGLAWAFVIAAFVNMTYHWVIFRNLLKKAFSISYSFGIFILIGILCLLTYRFKIELPLIQRIAIGTLLSGALFTYLYKVEYVKLKNNKLKKPFETALLN